MRFWALITSKKNWEICKAHRLWGLDYGYEETWDRFISKGDAATVYVTTRGFAAILDITGGKVYDETPIGWTMLYPYRFEVRIRNEGGPLKIRSSLRRDGPSSERASHFDPNLIDDLVFLTDKGAGQRGTARWNSFLYPSIVAILPEDFATIESRLSPGRRPTIQSPLSLPRDPKPADSSP